MINEHISLFRLFAFFSFRALTYSIRFVQANDQLKHRFDDIKQIHMKIRRSFDVYFC
jgi:hypothetical protein